MWNSCVGTGAQQLSCFMVGDHSWTACTSNLSLFTAGRGHACLQSQYSGGRGRRNYVRSRLAWCTKFQNSQGYTEKFCLEKLGKKEKPLSCASAFCIKQELPNTYLLKSWVLLINLYEGFEWYCESSTKFWL